MQKKIEDTCLKKTRNKSGGGAERFFEVNRISTKKKAHIHNEEDNTGVHIVHETLKING